MYLDWIKCNFDSQGTCSIKMHQHGEGANVSHYPYNRWDLYWEEEKPFTPKVLFHKGKKKTGTSTQRLIDSFQEAVLELNDDIDEPL